MKASILKELAKLAPDLTVVTLTGTDGVLRGLNDARAEEMSAAANRRGAYTMEPHWDKQPGQIIVFTDGDTNSPLSDSLAEIASQNGVDVIDAPVTVAIPSDLAGLPKISNKPMVPGAKSTSSELEAWEKFALKQGADPDVLSYAVKSLNLKAPGAFETGMNEVVISRRAWDLASKLVDKK